MHRAPPFPITPGGAEPSSGSWDAAAPGPPASSLLHPFPSPQPGPPRPAGTRLPVRGGSDEVMLLNIAISSQPFSPATRPGCRRLPALAEPPPPSVPPRRRRCAAGPGRQLPGCRTQRQAGVGGTGRGRGRGARPGLCGAGPCLVPQCRPLGTAAERMEMLPPSPLRLPTWV